MMKKMKQTSGETLAETLASVVIISLALLMLPGAVVAAARVNATAKKQVIYMENREEAPTGTPAGTCKLTISIDGKSETIQLPGVEVKRFGSEETGLYEIGLK